MITQHLSNITHHPSKTTDTSHLHNQKGSDPAISPHTAGAVSGNADTVLTIHQLLELCVQLQPEEAAARGDSALCVTPLITRLLVDGAIVDLHLKEGRWGAAYPRVSGEGQRAAGSAASKKKTWRRKSPEQTLIHQSAVDQGVAAPGSKIKGVADGYSEEEQLTRQIRYFLREGLAFKVYSDCGMTGEYPCNEPRLIRRLLDGKAARYKKIYERTLLDETSLLRRTPEEIASMRAYLDNRVAQIKGGQVTDDEFAVDNEFVADENIDGKEDKYGDSRAAQPKGGAGEEAGMPQEAMRNDILRRRGRPRKKVYFRQAFTQLWKDIAANRVHTVAVSDRSRLCRAADLESEFLLLLGKHHTRLVGLIEDLSTLDVSDPLKKGYAYLIASVNEYRLEEIAGHAFRGFLQMLESGRPHGKLPWWLMRDADGKAVEVFEYGRHARRIAELYLSGLGLAAIVTQAHAEGIQVGGEPLNKSLVVYVLDSDAVLGIHRQFGLDWHILPSLLPLETVRELRQRRLSRRDMLVGTLGEFGVPERTWANHLYTGLLRCACGRLLKYSQPSRTKRAEGDASYYYCTASHKRDEEIRHAWISEDKLTVFLSELLSENPCLIESALSAGGDRLARSTARRALLEERLRQARLDYGVKEVAARVKAAQTAVSAGIGEASASFAAVAAELCRGLLEHEHGELAALEEELAHLGAQAGQDRQAARVLAAVGQISGAPCLGADTLDARTRNSLLKAIFTEITIYPLKWVKRRTPAKDSRGVREESCSCAGDGERPHGCLVLRLAGVETPLPPVRMRRLRGKNIGLPTVAQWISDIYAFAPVEDDPDPLMIKRQRRSFHKCLLGSLAIGAALDTSVGQLAACVRSDAGFPRLSRGKDTISSYMTHTPLYSGVREHLDAVWELYRAAEETRHQRLAAARLAKKEDGSVVLNAQTMRPFRTVILCCVAEDAAADISVEKLAACIRRDPSFPLRSRGLDAIRNHLESNSIYDGVSGYLDAAWAHYRAVERERLRSAAADDSTVQ